MVTATSVMQSEATYARNTSAKRAECQESMPGFAHLAATIEQRQHYAECVSVMHPTANDQIGVYLVSAALIACAVLLNWVSNR